MSKQEVEAQATKKQKHAHPSTQISLQQRMQPVELDKKALFLSQFRAWLMTELKLPVTDSLVSLTHRLENGDLFVIVSLNAVMLAAKVNRLSEEELVNYICKKHDTGWPKMTGEQKKTFLEKIKQFRAFY